MSVIADAASRAAAAPPPSPPPAASKSSRPRASERLRLIWPTRDARSTAATSSSRISLAARSFLHHQVRNIVGTLAMVGTGKWTGDDVAAALAARDRSAAGPTAPPEGLYLTDVRYPSGI